MGLLKSFKKIIKKNKNDDNKLSECNMDTPLFSFNGLKFKCKVVKCYDGDTVHCVFNYDGKLQRFIVRMYGYNSQELRDKNIECKNEAQSARDRLADLILNKIVYLYCYDFDKYGRILGTIRFNDNDKEKSVNQIMLDEKYGEVYLP